MGRILDLFDFPLAVELIPLLALFLLPIKIWVSKSCAGVSGKTQILYAIVYITKWDFWAIRWILGENWGLALKVGFISMVFFTMYLIYGKFKDTNSLNEDSFKIGFLISLAATLAVVICWSSLFLAFSPSDFRAVAFDTSVLLVICWTFSSFIDCVAIFPQLQMIYQDKTNQTRRFIFYYVYAQGAYKALHLFNYIYDYSFYFRRGTIDDLASLTQVTLLFVFTCVYLRRKTLRFSSMVDNKISLNI